MRRNMAKQLQGHGKRIDENSGRCPELVGENLDWENCLIVNFMFGATPLFLSSTICVR